MLPMRIWAFTGVALLVACGAKPKARVRYSSYAVGSEQITIRDNSRSTPANGGSPALPYRDLPLYIWYPGQVVMTDGGYPPESSDAKLDPKGGPYPLAIFIHGFSGLSQQSTFLTQALAAKGYIVAAANFPQTYLLTPGGPSDADDQQQVGDASFIADQLFAKSKDSSDPLYSALDEAAGYAVIGHSSGGAVTLDAAYSLGSHDARVKGIVALAPDACFFSSAMFASRDVPMMLIAGTDDRYNPPEVNAKRAYSLATKSTRWLAMLTGGTHLFFTDFDTTDDTVTPDMPGDPITLAFGEDGGGDGCTAGPVTTNVDPLIDFQLQHSLTIQLSQAFLDKYLYDDSSAMTALAASHDAHLVLQSAGQ